MLAAEVARLQEEDVDLSLLGFGDEEIDDLLNLEEGNQGNTDDDAVPEAPVDPVTKLGDVYVLGNHRLLCGDSTVLSNVEKVLDGALADMVFTDPPYNVDYGNTAKDKMRGNDRKILNDNLGEGFETFLYDACVNMIAVCKGAIYVCMSSSELHTLQKAFVAAGGKWSTFVIWLRIPSRLGARTISASTSLSFMAGNKVRIISGAARAIKVTCGLSTSNASTICTRP